MATLKNYKRIVIKIGSSLLVNDKTGKLNIDWLNALASDIVNLKRKKHEIIVVSSGSIALGREALKLTSKSLALEESQAAAAVGQIQLARAYEDVLATHKITAAQVLVTLEDIRSRKRYLNSRATLNQLLSMNVIPIVNENDTVATEEIRYGDNDRLAAQVAVTVGADLVVLLSDVDGLYSADPSIDMAAKFIPEVTEITSEIEAMAGEARNVIAKGGMKTKIIAAKMATSGGASLVITRGSIFNPLEMLNTGSISTWFKAKDNPQQARKSWIKSMKACGNIIIDPGAEEALKIGKSLLPAGVLSVSGKFHRGDPVDISNSEGLNVGIGIVRYTATEAKKLIGSRLVEVEKILGYPSRKALIHRDDMAL